MFLENFYYICYTYVIVFRTMCAANKCSLEVSYVHLGEVHALLAIWLTDLPKEMLQIFDEVLYVEVIVLFPHYAKVNTVYLIPYTLYHTPYATYL